MEDELVTSPSPGVNGDAPESDQAEQTDGLLTQDKEELSERVTHLEKRVREQQDEISCLKGAMADLMRRVGQVEISKKNIRLLPMKPRLQNSVRAPVTAFQGRQSDSVSVNIKDQCNTQTTDQASDSATGQVDASLNTRSSLKSDYLSNLSSAQNSVLPSKPYLQSPRRTPAGKERPRSITSDSMSSRTGAPTSARQPPRGSSASSVKKWSSMSNSIDDVTGQKTSKSNSQLTNSNKQQEKGPSYDSNEKCGRNFVTIKGRNIPLWYYGDPFSEEDLKRSEHEPHESLKLDWVYGYRGKDTRNNLFEILSGEIVYFHAAVVVLFDVNEGKQRHYMEHTDDIKCLAVHPDKIRIATGQMAGHEKKEGKPHVRIWHSVSLSTVAIIGENDFQRAVACVAFSFDDKMLVVDDANDHTLSVWDISDVPIDIDPDSRKKDPPKKARKITETKSSRDPVTQCEFHPELHNLIVCCGKSQISFFTLEKKTLDKKNGIFEKYDKPKFVQCFAIHPETGEVISGDSSGNIFIWEKGGNKIKNAVEGAHVGSIFSICILKDNTILSGGGGNKDRKIIQWDSDLQKMVKEVQVEERYGAVRMISEGNGRILVGTIRNCILQSTIDFNELSPVTEGHKEELWGLCEIPDSNQFLTCGYDSFVYQWDASSHSVVWMMEIANHAHCCAVYNYGGKLLAVLGHRNKGAITLMDLSSHTKLGIFYPSPDHENRKYEQFECVEFSPDGAYVALGNRDNFIYVFEVQDQRKLHKVARCRGHSSFITHIDWAMEKYVIRSNSGDYSILYWDARTGKQLTKGKDLDGLNFATNNCTLSFNVGGIWPEGADGTDINNCSISHDRNLIATADDFGKVNLLNYPCLKPRALRKSYSGHSSHVTMAKFLADDSFLITTGGRDMSILQWKVCK